MGSSFCNCLDWKQVRCNSQRKLRHLGLRTDAGWQKATDSKSTTAHCTAQNLTQKEERGSLRVRGCSYTSSALTVLPRLQEVLSLTEKSGSLVVVKSSLFPWASGPHISEAGPEKPMCPQKTHRPHSCPWEVGALELCHLPGHINCPSLKNNTAPFPVSSLSFTKRKKPNTRVVRKPLVQWSNRRLKNYSKPWNP